jgi:hypothetical protein
LANHWFNGALGTLTDLVPDAEGRVGALEVGFNQTENYLLRRESVTEYRDESGLPYRTNQSPLIHALARTTFIDSMTNQHRGEVLASTTYCRYVGNRRVMISFPDKTLVTNYAIAAPHRAMPAGMRCP